MKTLSFLLLAFVLTNTVLGQTYYISNNPTFDSVIVAPHNPTSSDSVEFIIFISNEGTYRQFFSPGDSIYIVNDTIKVFISSFELSSTPTVNFIDTISIGTIAQGQYTVLIINRNTVIWGGPEPNSTSYRDTAIFTFQVVTSVYNKYFDANNISIFPIPTTDKIFVSNNSNERQIKNIVLLDLTGKQVLNDVFIYSENLADIDISSLATGIYFIKVTTTDNSIFTGKLVKINEGQ